MKRKHQIKELTIKLGTPDLEGTVDDSKLGCVEGWTDGDVETDGFSLGMLLGSTLEDGGLDGTAEGSALVDGLLEGSEDGRVLKVGESEGYQIEI